ncbi:MAG: cytochrome c oxidase subunit II [Burkholderiales bacterium]
MIKTLFDRIGIGALMMLIAGLAWAEDKAKWNLQEPHTTVAREMYDLHTIVLVICLIIFVGVFGAMFYSVIKHRKSVGHRAAHFHENTTVEILWTVIPFFILIGMAWPATKSVLAMRDTSSPDMTIKITGYQWKWGYEYLKGEGDLSGVADGVQFYSVLATPHDQIYGNAPKGEHYLLEVDNALVVPAGKKIRLLITANDVLHAWYMPAFGVKQDAVPGFIRDAWFRVDQPGIYRGQCAELCGKEHAFMPIVVEALEPAKFSEWAGKHKTAVAAAPTAVAAAAPSGPESGTAGKATGDGKATYEKVCSVCHAAGVAGAPKFGDKSAWAPRIATGAQALHNSALKGKNAMPPKGGMTTLPDADVVAAVDYMVKAAK